ncbi:MAG: exodeoxyribonuclease VII small subunit [Myxococcota bacterium]
MSKASTEHEDVKYSEAVNELEGLLEEIDSEDVDLDDLAVKVERASELIRVCRDKIENTEMQVRTIIEDLEGEQGDEG